MIGRGAQLRMLGMVMAIGAMGACKGDKLKPEEVKTVTAKDQYAIDSARMELDRVSAAMPSELVGSTWRLVQVRAPHDSVITPEKIAIFTVEFGSDGQVIVVAGCNRGGGTFTVTPPKGLSFGPLRTTRAMCPPGSISARYLADFAQMRGYAIVGGKLYIDLADGVIYQFAPELDIARTRGVGDEEPEVIFACLDSAGATTRIFALEIRNFQMRRTLCHPFTRARPPLQSTHARPVPPRPRRHPSPPRLRHRRLPRRGPALPFRFPWRQLEKRGQRAPEKIRQ